MTHDAIRIFLDQALDAVVAIDRQGLIVDWNAQASRIFGWSKDEALGRSLAETLIPPRYRTAHAQGLEHYFTTGEGPLLNHRIEITALRRDGTEFPVELTISPILMDHAPLFYSFIRDLTAEKASQKEMLRASKLESLGLLAGGIAHDFNNLLMAVTGNLSLAKLMVDADHRVVARLNESIKACFQARDLTQQLLTFSKRQTTVRKTLALGPTLAESGCFAVRGSTVQCEAVIDEDLWPVEVDPGQISQVINNLVLNAAQAMPQGGTVRLRGRNVSLTDRLGPLSAGDYIMISVKDQGVGIAPQELEKIFEPFFTTKHTGTGLGLTTSSWIVTQHGGHMTVDSTPGRGTTVTVYLPRSFKVPGPPDTDPAVSPGRGRVLVMDDEPAIRESVGGLLAHLGYEVDVSVDGADAIDRFTKAQTSGRPFDLVILDLTIRGAMGGQEALSRLRALDPRIKAVVATGYANDPVVGRFREFGFQAAIVKPFAFERLSETLRDVMAQ